MVSTLPLAETGRAARRTNDGVRLGGRPQEAMDFLAVDQAGQVDQHRNSHPRTKIGRARGQKAEALVVGGLESHDANPFIGGAPAGG